MKFAQLLNCPRILCVEVILQKQKRKINKVKNTKKKIIIFNY